MLIYRIEPHFVRFVDHLAPHPPHHPLRRKSLFRCHRDPERRLQLGSDLHHFRPAVRSSGLHLQLFLGLRDPDVRKNQQRRRGQSYLRRKHAPLVQQTVRRRTVHEPAPRPVLRQLRRRILLHPSLHQSDPHFIHQQRPVHHDHHLQSDPRPTQRLHRQDLLPHLGRNRIILLKSVQSSHREELFQLLQQYRFLAKETQNPLQERSSKSQILGSRIR